MTCTRTPKYCLHRPSNRAYSRFGTGSKPTYFPGRYGSPESQAAYHAALAEWLAGARPSGVSAGEALTIRQLLASWWIEAKRRYRKFNRPTKELSCQQCALRYVAELYADLPASAFGPVQLMTVQARMVQQGWVRTSINLHVCRIRAVWKWAAAQGLVPVAAWTALTAVSGLRRGRTEAIESTPKRPVTWQQLRAVLRSCSPMVAAMIRLQYRTGMRPSEVCAMRPVDVDRDESDKLWLYRVRPEVAKTAKEVYWLGPECQRILKPWLTGPEGEPIWAYTVNGYRRHITRCCSAAGCPSWAPHQLRHSHGTRVRDLYGIEGAASRLNHSKIDTTEIYTGRSSALARRIAREIG